MSTVPVTGGSGFVGSHVILQLLADGHVAAAAGQHPARDQRQGRSGARLDATAARGGDRRHRRESPEVRSRRGRPVRGRRVNLTQRNTRGPHHIRRVRPRFLSLHECLFGDTPAWQQHRTDAAILAVRLAPGARRHRVSAPVFEYIDVGHLSIRTFAIVTRGAAITPRVLPRRARVPRIGMPRAGRQGWDVDVVGAGGRAHRVCAQGGTGHGWR